MLGLGCRLFGVCRFSQIAFRAENSNVVDVVRAPTAERSDVIVVAHRVPGIVRCPSITWTFASAGDELRISVSSRLDGYSARALGIGKLDPTHRKIFYLFSEFFEEIFYVYEPVEALIGPRPQTQQSVIIRLLTERHERTFAIFHPYDVIPPLHVQRYELVSQVKDVDVLRVEVNTKTAIGTKRVDFVDKIEQQIEL